LGLSGGDSERQRDGAYDGHNRQQLAHAYLQSDPDQTPHPASGAHLAPYRSLPSAHTVAMIRQESPRLPQSERAASFACAILLRAVIAQALPECANAAHSDPKKLTSTAHSADRSLQEDLALATASLRVACAQAIPHLSLALA
jgi:hypothetical protein